MFKDNFQVAAGRESRFAPSPLISLLVFILLFAVGQLSSIPFRSLIQGHLGHLGSDQALALNITLSALVVPFGLLMAVFFAYTKWVEKRPLRTLGFGRKAAVAKYFKGFAVGMLMMGAYFVLALLTGSLKAETFQYHFTDLGVWISVFLVLPGWLIQGASEEIMTRGWLYQSVSAKHGGYWGIVIAPSIFGVLHVLNANGSVVSMLNLILFGLFAVLYVLQDGGLWGICALHSAWNWTQGNLLGIRVSGNPVIGGALVAPGSVYGEPYITGGGFGAEGSVLITLILIMGIAYLLTKIRARHGALKV